MGIVSSSKECPECSRRYPSACGIAVCLVDKVALIQVYKSATVDEDEFNDLSYIYGRKIPGPLSEEERGKVEAEWEAIEAEAERRAPWYSVADLIGDRFSVREDK